MDRDEQRLQHKHKVLTELLGIPASLLDNQWHDCPLCGEKEGFKGDSTERWGVHLICNGCGNPDHTGGIVTLAEAAEQILKCDRATALARIDEFLGLDQPRPKQAPPQPRQRMSAMDAADGRWPQLLEALAGITPEQLTDRHQPCPLCGGTDRYRWDRDDGPGGWFCNQCGGKDQRGGGGTGMDLLMRSTGWSFKEACRRVEQHLGIAAPPAPAKPRPQPPTQGAEKAWAYSDTFLVCRFPGKRIRPLSWDGEQWRWAAPKAPRPLLYLDQLLARPGDPVIVAEGEKAADAAGFLFPTHVATTWPSGCKAIGKADWKPLTGRSVVLWPDADEVGIQAMDTLAQQLLELGAVVSVVTPPPDVEPGWDLADATWSIDEAAAYLEANCTRLEPLPAPEPPPAAEPGREPFTCLGYDADRCYYLPRATGHIIHITRAGHSSTQLVYLAPLAYREAVYPSKAGVNWTHAVSDLFAKQGRPACTTPIASGAAAPGGMTAGTSCISGTG